MDNLNKYIQQNKDRFLEELFDLLKKPSISTDSKYKKDIEATAEAVKISLQKAGCDNSEVFSTPGNPVVYGEKIIDKKLPTVLVYGHYDVQPPDPMDLWDSPPFEPVIKKTEIHPEGAIFARGSCDDKGQMFMHIKALETMMEHDALPCNIKFMIEGEEEIGSPNLGWFIEQHRKKLDNDVILVSDTSMLSKETPSITTGLRGLSYLEVEVKGPNRDLHSGLYGGAVANPINVLTRMISALHDEDKRIAIPGFYDKVREHSKEERQTMAEAPFDQEAYNKKLGVKAVEGEQGYSTLERASIRPTLDVNGIWGGYMGEGSKTVIPDKAHAKISMRLVPNQEWEEVAQLFKKHFEKIAPESVSVNVQILHGGEGYVTPIDSVEYEAASKAMQEAFGQKPIPQPSGGSIPIVSLFERKLDSKIILMGFGLDTDAIHSPNEHYGVWNFFKGIETIPLFYKHFSKLKK